MLDGIELKGRCCVVALGITTDGVKIPLGLWDGSTENATVAKQLLSNLVARGLDLGQGVLCVVDGAKALRKAIDEVLGPVPVQRCVRHKERNVLDHLPERDRPPVKQRLRRAWARDDHERAQTVEKVSAIPSRSEAAAPGWERSSSPASVRSSSSARSWSSRPHALRSRCLTGGRSRSGTNGQRRRWIEPRLCECALA